MAYLPSHLAAAFYDRLRRRARALRHRCRRHHAQKGHDCLPAADDAA